MSLAALFFLILQLIERIPAPPPPIIQETQTSSGKQRLSKWASIERLHSLPDAILLRKSECEKNFLQSPCQKFFEAIHEWPNSSEPERCLCRCPPERPIFLQTIEKCVSKLGECLKPIKFEKEDDHNEESHFFYDNYVPLINLPNSGEVLAPELKIAWKESAVKLKPNIGPRCKIVETSIATADKTPIGSWQKTENGWFKFHWVGNDAKIMWNDDQSEGEDASRLQGAIVKLGLDCAIRNRSAKNAHCLAFRIPGQISTKFEAELENIPNGLTAGMVKLSSGRKLEIMIILLLAILLFISLVGSILLWKICWRIKRQKLIRSLQLQFMYLAKQEKDKSMTETLRIQAMIKAAASAAASGNTQSLASILNSAAVNNGVKQMCYSEFPEQIELESQQHLQQHGSKRKLYFSPEFFEPQNLKTPPLGAEQFLQDLRRMISMAREKIRTRRHVPQLHSIAELEDEKDENMDQTKCNGIEKKELPPLSPPNNEYGKLNKTPKYDQEEAVRDGSITIKSIVQQQEFLQQSIKPSATIPSSISPQPSRSSIEENTADSGRGDSTATAKEEDVEDDLSNSKFIVDTESTENSSIGDEKEAENQEATKHASIKVTNIIQKFETMNDSSKEPQSQQQNGLNSRIPVAKSPRLSPKLSTNHSLASEKSITVKPKASDNLTVMCPEKQAMPSPEGPIQQQRVSRICTESSIPQLSSKKRFSQSSNSYAVYPSDSMKKSLPRRKKIGSSAITYSSQLKQA